MTRAVQIAELGDQSVFTIDSSNNRVGIGSTQPTEKLNVDGVVVATAFTGDGSGLTAVSASAISGTPDITINNITGVAATFSGNVNVSGTLTYEDVTNIDSVGIITAQSHVSIADSILHTGDTDTSIRFPSTGTFTINTDGTERLRVTSSGLIGIGNENPNAELSVNNATANASVEITRGSSGAEYGYRLFGSDGATSSSLKFFPVSNGSLGSEAARFDASGRLLLGTTTEGNGGADQLTISTSEHTGVTLRSGTTHQGNIFFADGTSGDDEYRGIIRYDHNDNSMQIRTNAVERLRVTSTGGVHFNNAELIERVSIAATNLSNQPNINLDNGMIHHFTGIETTTATPNIISTAGINTNMAVGDAMSVTIITTAAAAGYAATVHIDGLPLSNNSGSLNWTGGTAPSAGGASGVDIYAYTIIKTASAKYTAIASLTKTSA